MAKNTNLHNAKSARNDEFYTQLTDIEKEMKYYRSQFKGKVVYCNCDDARESNFFKYFSLNFEFLGLKKLITTGFKVDGHGVALIYEGDRNGNYMVDDEEIKVVELEGNGDFRSEECIAFLKEADIVVTNPPFSLFREYVAQLMEYEKKFIILGNNNAITYKEIFPLIKNSKVWLGRTLFTGKMPFFRVPNEFAEKINNDRYEVREDGVYKQVNSICWFTNISNTTNKEILSLYKKYSPESYPHYDNYNAIEVARMETFPMDYDGVAGIPITGLKYLWDDGTIHMEINGETTQFEIVWTTDRGGDGMIDYLKNPNWDGLWDSPFVNGKKTYKRIFIKKVCE